jgi:hypothetical protein
MNGDDETAGGEWKPVASTEDLLSAAVGNEAVVYDVRRDRALSLNPLATAVWQACSGGQLAEEMAAPVGEKLGEPVSQDAVWAALRELVGAGLVNTPPTSDSARLNRRSLVRGLVSATPLVASLVIPPPAAAASGFIDGPNDWHPFDPNGGGGGGGGGVPAAALSGGGAAAAVPAAFLLPACREKRRRLDLQPSANRPLSGTDLRDLFKGSGVQTVAERSSYEGVPFWLGPSLMALASKDEAYLPQQAVATEVREKFERLYLLQTAFGSTAPTGDRLAHYLVRYADGGSVSIPVDEGLDVSPAHGVGGVRRFRRMRSRAVWASAEGQTLFMSVWKNPRPGVEVTSVEFVSGFTVSTPACVAMTIGSCHPEKETRTARR